MLDYFKRLKAFQIIAAIVIVGLLYGAFNLYTKKGEFRDHLADWLENTP